MENEPNNTHVRDECDEGGGDMREGRHSEGLAKHREDAEGVVRSKCT